MPRMRSAGKRTRRRSIRSTLIGLLVIPLVSLLMLWGFAAEGTARDALEKRNIDDINRIYGGAAVPVLTQLAQERLQSVIWLSGRGELPRTQLDAQRQKTDPTLRRLEQAARSDEFQNLLSDPAKQRLSTLLNLAGNLDQVRQDVDSGSVDKLAVFNAYNDILDAHFQFSYRMVVIKDATVYQQAVNLIDISRAQEMTAREATLVGGALVGGARMTRAEHAAFTELVIEQRYLVDESIAKLSPELAAPLRQLLASDAYKDFRAQEDRIMGSRPGRTPIRIDPAAWESGSQGFIGGIGASIEQNRVVLAEETKALGDRILQRLAIIGAVGLVAVLLSGLLIFRFGRRVTRELVGLEGAATDLADRRLPHLVERLRAGQDVDVAAEAPPLGTARTAEVSNVSEAFSKVQRTAVEAAVGESELRQGVNRVFRNLARRNQSLLHRQLAMLDTLERKASDPDALEDLFRIDHLTTRMRRHAEGLIILSGAHPGRNWRRPVGVVDVLRGASGEIEDYARVDVVSTAREAIVGTAVADIVHLLAELIENAVTFSPPNTPVEVDAGLVGNGFVIEVQDRGLAMSSDKLAAVNDQLTRPPEFSLPEGDQLGLFVVANLAHRHGIRISLEPNAYGGLKTIVLLPPSLVVSEADAAQGDSIDDHDVDRAGERAGESAASPAEPGEVPMTPAPDPAAQDDPSATGGRHRASPAETTTDASRTAAPTAPDVPAPVPEPVPGPGLASVPAPAPAPASATGPHPTPPDPDAQTHAGMPRRVRRASLAPQLREQPAPSGDDERGSTTTTGDFPRSPERARSVMTSMQSGWRRGRDADPGTGAPEDDTDSGQGER